MHGGFGADPVLFTPSGVLFASKGQSLPARGASGAHETPGEQQRKPQGDRMAAPTLLL